MQIKEISELTGLTKRTIRYYEEEGLFSPSTERKNGRVCRDYSKEDVDMLLVISSLRKALFSIDEIKTMVESPQEIAHILPQHIIKLELEHTALENLIAVIKDIPPQEVSSVVALSHALSPETRSLPLPPADITPHFRYLDEMEPFNKKQKRHRVTTEDAYPFPGIYPKLSAINLVKDDKEELHTTYAPSRNIPFSILHTIAGLLEVAAVVILTLGLISRMVVSSILLSVTLFLLSKLLYRLCK